MFCVCPQNVGKAMSVSSFVSNLDGMNEGENFSKELLKVRLSFLILHLLNISVETVKCPYVRLKCPFSVLLSLVSFSGSLQHH